MSQVADVRKRFAEVAPGWIRDELTGWVSRRIECDSVNEAARWASAIHRFCSEKDWSPVLVLQDFGLVIRISEEKQALREEDLKQRIEGIDDVLGEKAFTAR